MSAAQTTRRNRARRRRALVADQRWHSGTRVAKVRSDEPKAPTPAARPSSRDGASRRRALQITLLAASLGFAVVQLDVSVVNVAVKSIGSSLGGGVSALQWVVSAYTVTFAAFILTAGSLSDRIGARRSFISGFLLFTAASAICGVAPNLVVLVSARAAQGIGAATLVPASLSLLSHSYRDPAGRARAVGLYLAGASTTLSGGPLIGGLLIAWLGWRAIFFINVPIAAAGVALTLGWASETPRARDRTIDLPGQTTAVVTLVALVAATIEGGRSGFGSPLVLAGFALAVATGAVFVWVEKHARDPLLPLRLFRIRRFGLSTVIGLLINVPLYGLIFLLSLLFQREQHLSPLQTGAALLPMTVAITAANLLASRISRRLGPPGTVAIGALLVGSATASLLGLKSATPYPAIIAQISALGFGTGLSVAVITSLTLGSVDESRSGVAAGTLNTARQTGSAIAVAVFGSLITAVLIPGLHIALAICTALMLMVAGLAPALNGGGDTK